MRSHFSYTVIDVNMNIKFLAVVTPPPDIYHVFSTWKTFCEEKFAPVNMTSYVGRRFKKDKEIYNSEQ